MRWLRETRDVLLGIATVALTVGPPLAALGAASSCSSVDRVEGIDLPAIAQGVERYRVKLGRTPEKVEELVAAGIFEHVPTDPWNGPYLLARSEHGLKVMSFGRDGMPGGCGQDTDLEHFIDDPARNAAARRRDEGGGRAFEVSPARKCR